MSTCNKSNFMCPLKFRYKNIFELFLSQDLFVRSLNSFWQILFLAIKTPSFESFKSKNDGEEKKL